MSFFDFLLLGCRTLPLCCLAPEDDTCVAGGYKQAVTLPESAWCFSTAPLQKPCALATVLACKMLLSFPE